MDNGNWQFFPASYSLTIPWARFPLTKPGFHGQGMEAKAYYKPRDLSRLEEISPVGRRP